MSATVLVARGEWLHGRPIPPTLAQRRTATRGMSWAPDGCPTARIPISSWCRPTNVPERPYWEVNVRGVQNRVEETAAAGVERLIQCSTVFIQCSTAGPHGTVRTRRPTAKARRILDHQPEIRPEEGRKEMVRSHRKAGWL